MDNYIETALMHRRLEDRTAGGERGIDRYTQILFPDVNSSNYPIHCKIIDLNGTSGFALHSPAFEKTFKDTFDTSGVKILDLGAGVGNLSRDQAELGWNSQIIGVDLTGKNENLNVQSFWGDNSKEIPKSPNSLVGDWTRLPIKDNTFDFILSYESFPRYLYPAYQKDDHNRLSAEEFRRKSFEEITRVAKSGCIWRGTVASQIAEYPNTELGKIQLKYSNPVFKTMLDYGWSRIISYKNIFIALKS